MVDIPRHPARELALEKSPLKRHVTAKAANSFPLFFIRQTPGAGQDYGKSPGPALYGGIRTFTAVRAEMFRVFKGGLERSSITALASPVMGMACDLKTVQGRGVPITLLMTMITRTATGVMRRSTPSTRSAAPGEEYLRNMMNAEILLPHS